MALSTFVLECPYCHWMFKAKQPDRHHSVYSFAKPLIGSFHGEVIEQNIVCRNPKCKKPITIYWYAPMDYFNQI